MFVTLCYNTLSWPNPGAVEFRFRGFSQLCQNTINMRAIMGFYRVGTVYWTDRVPWKSVKTLFDTRSLIYTETYAIIISVLVYILMLM